MDETVLKRKHMRALKISLILLFLLGCNSTSVDNLLERDARSSNDKSKKLYAKLVKVGNSYVFGEFATSAYTTMWVRLNDLKPAWDVSNVQLCSKSLTLGTNCKEEPEYFRTFETNTGFTAFQAVFTLGLDTVLNGARGSVKFDSELYKAAIKQAVKNLSFQGSHGLVALDSMIKKYNESVKKSSTIESSFKQILSSVEPYILVNDKTGLYDDRFQFKDFIDFEIKTASIKDKIYSYNSYASYDELMMVISSYEKDLSSFPVDISCKSPNDERFKTNLECPKVFTLKRNNKQIPIKVNITSANFSRVLPKYLSKSNDKIELVFNGASFTVKNMTDEFLKLERLSFYYGENIASTDLNVTLPPLSESNLTNIYNLPIKWHELEFNSLTREYAEKHEVIFGFAIKYQTSTLTNSSTLFTTKPIKLIELI